MTLSEALRAPVRFSHLKHIARSPLHYRHSVEQGFRDQPWLRGGRGLHAVLFQTLYVIFEGASRNSKEWNQFVAKRELLTAMQALVTSDRADRVAETLSNHVEAWKRLSGSTEKERALWAEAAEHAPEAEVMLRKEYELNVAMAEAILFELDRLELTSLLAGDTEKRIDWEWLGRKCGGTPDVVGPKRIVDVKTTCNADPKRFVWDARKFFYAEQLAWYAQGVALQPGGAWSSGFEDMFIIAVEKTPPHPVVVWQVTDRMREQAEKTIRIWMETLLSCEASNVWPGYTQRVEPLDVLESEEPVGLIIGGEEIEA